MSDESIIEEESLVSSRFSRRSLIKAGAIVGGTVWVAPLIESFTSPAAAASCISLAGCYVCFSEGGNAFYAASDNPGPYEAIQGCINNSGISSTDGGPYSSGSYILFNTCDSKGSFGDYVNSDKTVGYCEYSISSQGGSVDLNNACPATYSSGGHPVDVTCQTGSWSV